MGRKGKRIIDYIIDSKMSEEDKQRMILKLISIISYSSTGVIDKEALEEIKRVIKEKENVQSKDTPTTF